MDDFIAAAGLTHGALYDHFRDRRGCFRRSSPRSTSLPVPAFLRQFGQLRANLVKYPSECLQIALG